MLGLVLSVQLSSAFDFCEASNRIVQSIQTQTQDAFSGVLVDEIDAVIRDENTWRYIAVAADLAQEADHVGSWSEACPCHGNFTEQCQEEQVQAQARHRKRRKLQPHGFLPVGGDVGGCPFKGCRSYELAAGGAMESLRDKMMHNRQKLLAHVATAQEAERHNLVADWERARSRLWGDLVMHKQPALYSPNA